MHPVWKTEASIVGLSVLGVLFLIVSVSTNYWRSFRSKDVYSHQGLWKTCEHVFATGKRECVKLERSKYDELWGSGRCFVQS